MTEALAGVTRYLSRSGSAGRHAANSQFAPEPTVCLAAGRIGLSYFVETELESLLSKLEVVLSRAEASAIELNHDVGSRISILGECFGAAAVAPTLFETLQTLAGSPTQPLCRQDVVNMLMFRHGCLAKSVRTSSTRLADDLYELRLQADESGITIHLVYHRESLGVDGHRRLEATALDLVELGGRPAAIASATLLDVAIYFEDAVSVSKYCPRGMDPELPHELVAYHLSVIGRHEEAVAYALVDLELADDETLVEAAEAYLHLADDNPPLFAPKERFIRAIRQANLSPELMAAAVHLEPELATKLPENLPAP